MVENERDFEMRTSRAALDRSMDIVFNADPNTVYEC
jgi:hypothetical protein